MIACTLALNENVHNYLFIYLFIYFWGIPTTYPGLNIQRPKFQTLNMVQKGVCHTVALPFTLKSILRQKKNYGKKLKYISPCKNIILKKIPLKKKPKSLKIL